MRLLIVTLLTASAACAQLSEQQGGTGTRPSTNLPATCRVGRIFFKTDATAGQNIYLCTSTNAWTQVTGGGGGSGNMTISTGAGDPSGACTAAQTWYLNTSPTPREVWFCDTSGTWQRVISTLNTGAAYIDLPGSTSGTMRIIAPATGGGTVTGPTGTTTLLGDNTVQTITNKSISASQINSGTMATARLGSGTADATTFLRGDQTYAVPPDSGGGSSTPAVTYTFTSQTTVTINAATTSVNVTPTTAHGMGTLARPTCFDSATPRVAMLCDYTRDTSGNLVFTFSPSQSGQIQVGSDGGGSGSARASITTAGSGFNAPWGGTYISAVSLAANVVVYQQFVQPFGETVATIGIYIGGIAASKSIAYGIYDSSCNLISGATGRFTGAAGAGVQTIALTTPAALTDVGVYHLGIATEDAAATIGSTGGSTMLAAFNLGTDRRFFTGANAATGTAGTYALPSACGSKTVSTNPILFGVLLP